MRANLVSKLSMTGAGAGSLKGILLACIAVGALVGGVGCAGSGEEGAPAGEANAESQKAIIAKFGNPRAETTEIISYGARGTALSAQVLGETLSFGDTGNLPASGGSASNDTLSPSVPGVLSAGVLEATASGSDNESSASASTSDLKITLSGLSVEAQVVEADASTSWSGAKAATAGGSRIAGLTVNGTPINVTGEPNQTINLLVGTIVINEQATSTGPATGVGAGSATSTAITVNALHVTVAGVANIIVSHATASIVGDQETFY